jgi:hypothetical protein
MRFRKKPVVVEAMQTGPDTALDVLNWIRTNGGTGNLIQGGALDIVTLEGVMRASAGDWVIRGVQGEFYPCKPDIFLGTYEPVA